MSENKKVLGIVFANMHEHFVSELTELRTMASVPFGGRYRLIDFTLSDMVAAGVDNVGVVVKRNYVSLMDHVGSGREYDLARKIGGLKIFPPFGERGNNNYTGKLEALNGIMRYITDTPFDLAILTDSNFVASIDYTDVVDRHVKTGADITAVYKTEIIDESVEKDNVTFEVGEDKRITAVYLNEKAGVKAANSMWAYVVNKELLIDLVKEGVKKGLTNFEKDVLQAKCGEIKLYGYEYTGYLARISSMKSYFDANLALTKKENMRELFSKHPVYTKIRDDAPARYIDGSSIKASVVADGCYIEGYVDNSVLFRGVKIGKDAVVINCVLMQDTVVESGAYLENVICDKETVITRGKKLKGERTHPVYVEKQEII